MDLAVIALRWTLYLLLGLVFGLALFNVYAPSDDRGDHSPSLSNKKLALLSLGAIAASMLAFTVQFAAMAGTPWPEMDLDAVSAILTQTALGMAIIVRLGALLIVALTCLTLKSRPRSFMATTTLASGVALATLAWSGHGAASEGTGGWVHLFADILHLLAAGAWIGAIAAFLAGLFHPTQPTTASRLHWLTRALIRFGTVGAITVAILTVTGVVNMVFLIRAEDLTARALTLYLYLLAAKLAAFGGMLVLATLHKFRLVPALEKAVVQGATFEVTANLRRSILLEMILALSVLGLVAWLGTLPPPASL